MSTSYDAIVIGAGPAGEVCAGELADGGMRVAKAVGETLAQALEAEDVSLRLGEFASGAERDGDEFVLSFDDRDELRAEKLLVAAGREPRIDGLGIEALAIEPGRSGIEVDEHLRAGENVWAVGDVTGVAMFTHVGKYQARVAAADMLGNPAAADYRAVPRVVFTDPQVAAVGAPDGERSGTTQLAGVARTSTYTREYDERPGFLTVISDGERLTGAHAVGPEAGEWVQQATLGIRAEIPVAVLRDTIQPFPTFSEAFVNALSDLG